MKVSLCLSGGGIKGVAHIGVLKAFQESGVCVESIGGTSSGSIVAILYAAGFNADEIYYIFRKYAKKIKYFDYVNILKLIFGIIFTGEINIDGFNSGRIIEKLVNKECNKKGIYSMMDLKKIVIIPSVDIESGEVICFTSNTDKKVFLEGTRFIYDISVGKAVRASSSYPVVFSPCEYRERKLVDGGIRENVPWRELKAFGFDNILSVVFESEKSSSCKNFIEVASKSFSLLCKELLKYEMKDSGNVLNIKTKKVGLLQTSKIDYLYNLGYEKGKEFIKKNKAVLKGTNKT